MQFTTQIPISKSSFPIDYNSKIISLGSCFAINMAEKFDYFKFQNAVNPFGVLFHPMAIEKFISFAANRKTITAKDIFFHNERWHCFDAHSNLSHSDKAQLLQNLNAKISETNEHFSNASHAIITYGTAWIYHHIESGEIVANCHKLPQKHFKKELLSVAVIKKSIQNTIELLKKINPELQVIFTISPVRHIKDGFVENQRSKSNLISGLQEVIDQSRSSGNETAHYFPSYEIMMDELRDYRFYTDDMIHPNQTAIAYIWKRFSETWISNQAIATMEKINSIQKGLQHRPFNPDSQSHKLFLSRLKAQILLLQQEFPHLHF